MAKVTDQDLKDDFKLFVCYVWSLLGLPAPTKVQLLICDYLQDEKYSDKIIQAFRGVGKSYLTSCYVLWRLWRNKDLKFLIISASKIRADDFSNFCFILLDLVPQLNHLKPTEKDRASKVAWDVHDCAPAQSCSVTSKGITSQIAGARADVVIADDIEVKGNSATADQREKLKNLVADFESIKKGDEGHGSHAQTVFLGTPQTEESVYNDMRGFHKRIWPSRYPTEDKLRDLQGDICPYLEDELADDPDLVGKPTDPKRFSDEVLLAKELKMGRSSFALQFQLDTSLSDSERYPLKLSDLIVYEAGGEKAPVSISWSNSKDNQLTDLPALGFSSDRYYKPNYVDPNWVSYEGGVMAIDPSGRGKDETAYLVLKYLHGYLFVTKVGSISGGYEKESLESLAKIAKDQSVNSILVESNFGDGMYAQLLRPIVNRVYPCPIDEVRHHTQKELRIIDTLEPVMNSHKLIVSQSAIQEDFNHTKRESSSDDHAPLLYSLFYQMTRITKERGSLKHDDRLDALAMAVGHFTDMMSRDDQKAVTEAEEARLDDAMKLLDKREWDNDRYISGDDYFNGLLSSDKSPLVSGGNSFLDNI